MSIEEEKQIKKLKNLSIKYQWFIDLYKDSLNCGIRTKINYLQRLSSLKIYSIEDIPKCPNCGSFCALKSPSLPLFNVPFNIFEPACEKTECYMKLKLFPFPNTFIGAIP